jgi:hypothetical protein
MHRKDNIAESYPVLVIGGIQLFPVTCRIAHFEVFYLLLILVNIIAFY